MKITQIKIQPVSREGKLKGYVSVTFDDVFVVHNIKIVDGKAGNPIITMPSRKTKTGEFKDIAHPITSEFRNELQTAVLNEFENQTD